MENKLKRYAIIGVSSVLLVAMVVVMTIGFIGNQKENSKNDKHITLSKKTFLDICHAVDFRDACMANLPLNILRNHHNHKDLLRLGFEGAMKHLRIASKRALSLGLLHREPLIKGALSGCSELTDMAISDLQRSLDKFINHEMGTLARILNDILFWVSGAMTYQETCIDGFLNTNGLIGQNMRFALRTGMELTTNALAMVTEFATQFESSIEVKATIHNRRLKSMARFPEWLDSNKRRLLEDNQGNVKADLIVAQDGSGKYKTINEALWDIPKHSDNTFVLYIKEGVYNEQVQFNSSMTHVMVVGDGPLKTRVTGSLNVVDGTTTYRSATVSVSGDYFIAKDIGFENTAGPEKHQAVALRVGADRSIFYNCQMDGYQDTLYTHTYRQFYRECVISGTVDFVFGDAAAVFQDCTFLVRKPMDNQQCIVTAQGRKNVRQPTGIIFQNCTITDDSSLQPVKNKIPSYLGRPWKEYSRTVIMESYIDDVIRPEGFLPWNGTFALDTLFYTEFNNRGPGSNKDKRVKWPGIMELTPDRIQHFTATKFIEGDKWVPSSKVPYTPGLMFEPPKQDASSPVTAQENADSAYMNKRESYDSHNNFTSSPPLPTPADASPPAPVSDDQGSSTSPAADNSASPSDPKLPSTDIGTNSASPSEPTVPSTDTGTNFDPPPVLKLPPIERGSNFDIPPVPKLPPIETGSNFNMPSVPELPSTETGSNFDIPPVPKLPPIETGSNFDIPPLPKLPPIETGLNFDIPPVPKLPPIETGSDFYIPPLPKVPPIETGSDFDSPTATTTPDIPSTKLDPNFPFSTVVNIP